MLTFSVFSLTMKVALNAFAVIVPKVEPAAALGAFVISNTGITVGRASATSVRAGLQIESGIANAAVSFFITSLAVCSTVVALVHAVNHL